jgi:hypothetical protein
VDNFIELTPFVLSIGVFYSFVFQSFAVSFSDLEQHWHRHEAAAGSSLGLICRNPAINPVQRWIAGKARRMEAPDDEDIADCPDLSVIFTKFQEDNREKNLFDASMDQVRIRSVFWSYPAACARRVFVGKLQYAD